MKHEDARKRVCFCCFRKAGPKENLDNASDLLLSRVEKHVISDLNIHDNRVPIGLCVKCCAKINNIEKGRKSTIDLTILTNYLDEQKRLSLRKEICDCVVCKIAKSFGGEAASILVKYKQTSGRPCSTPKEIPRKLCGICLHATYVGSGHDKTLCGTKKYKLENIYNQLSSQEREQFASIVNRETAAEAGSSTFSLKTLGQPQTVTLGKPSETKRTTPNQRQP